MGFVVFSTVVLSLVMGYYGKKEVNKAMCEMEEEEEQKRRELQDKERGDFEEMGTVEILEMDTGKRYDEETPNLSTPQKL